MNQLQINGKMSQGFGLKNKTKAAGGIQRESFKKNCFPLSRGS